MYTSKHYQEAQTALQRLEKAAEKLRKRIQEREEAIVTDRINLRKIVSQIDRANETVEGYSKQFSWQPTRRKK